MKELAYDIAVIGGGAAGLTAGAKCASQGVKTLIIERTESAGGVLLQCIHSGFGLHYFNEELTGPEYAARVFDLAEKAGADFMLSATVMRMKRSKDTKEHVLTVYSKEDGVVRVHARAVILAMGCRERCRGNLGIPGERIPGVFSAGMAQQLLNTEGLLPGTKAVIVGSGDIGLIMARRLTWSGIKVECVIEIMPYPAGLSRNIAQCLEDFNIPLYLSSSVTGIRGRDRVESITYAPLVNGKPDLTREKKVECDTVLFSVGLVPENELSRECGIELDPLTGGAKVDGNLMTGVPGVFSCGNVLHVHDLVDFVSKEAENCASCAVKWCRGELAAVETTATAQVIPGNGVRYTVPCKVDPERDNHFFLRSRSVMDRAELAVTDQNGRKVFHKKLAFVKPAEMISFELPSAASAGSSALTVTLEETEK